MNPIALLRDEAFSPQDAALFEAAYHDVLAAIDLRDPKDGTAYVLAAKIVELAKAGERDRARIVARVIQDLKLPLAFRLGPPGP